MLQVSKHDTGAEAIRVASSSSVLKAIGSAKDDAGLQSALAKRQAQEEESAMEETEGEEDEDMDGDATDEEALMEAQADIGFCLLEGSSNKRKTPPKKEMVNPKRIKEAESPSAASLAAVLHVKGRGRGSVKNPVEADAEMTPGQESLVTKGEEALQKLKTNYSAEKLWEGPVRSRQIEALAKSSSQIASKLSALPLGCQRGHDLSSEIMGQVSSAQEMFELFTTMRADIAPFLDTMEKDAEELLLSCDMSVLSGMLLKTAADFIKKTDSQASRLKARFIF